MGGLSGLIDDGYEKGTMKKVSIFDVADYFIALAASEQNGIITLLSLQRLCFYAAAWSLVWDQKPLFDEEFVEGEYGPYSNALSHKYESLEAVPISLNNTASNIDIFTDKQRDIMDAVWDAYGTHGLVSGI